MSIYSAIAISQATALGNSTLGRFDFFVDSLDNKFKAYDDNNVLVDDITSIDASGVTYTITVPSDWDGSPSDVQAALDELASRVNIVENNSLTTVSTDATLSGNGTPGDPLSVVSSPGSIQSVTGDGVDNTDPVNPVLSFPDADEVDDTSTTNKFSTQAQLDQIATNTSDILLKRDLTAQKNSIEDDSGDLQLVGDVASPGGNQYYGTNISGVRGWQPLLSFNVDLDSAEASVSRAVAGGRTTFTVTHSLNTLDLIVQVFRLSDGRGVNWRIERTGVNTIEASRAGSVADGDFRILIR